MRGGGRAPRAPRARGRRAARARRRAAMVSAGLPGSVSRAEQVASRRSSVASGVGVARLGRSPARTPAASPSTVISRSTGSSTGCSAGSLLESATLSPMYHSPGAGNLTRCNRRPGSARSRARAGSRPRRSSPRRCRRPRGRRGLLEARAELLGHRLAQRREDVHVVVEVVEPWQVVVGRVVGLDLGDVDGRAGLEHLPLGQLDLPVHGLARGDRVGVAAGLEQRRGVERAAADDRLARPARARRGREGAARRASDEQRASWRRLRRGRSARRRPRSRRRRARRRPASAPPRSGGSFGVSSGSASPSARAPARGLPPLRPSTSIESSASNGLPPVAL